jgi:serine/threonine protein kinase
LALSEHKNSLKPGYKLHWYKIKSILGQGAFGITYLAHDLNLDRDVAIKEYLPLDMAVREGDYSIHPVTNEHGDEFKWGLDRFISEARTLAKFDHGNIVRVYSVFEENNTGYMVMRYEEGQNLKEKIQKDGTISESEIIDIIMPILNGLEIIHKHGFIHRDIKPDNIYIRDDGSPVLIDFGSARHALGEKTKTLTSVVTPGYAPIEQYYSKSDEQGPWTDIYALGATVYRAITGVGLLDAIDRSKGILEVSRDSYVSTFEICEGKYSPEFLKAIDHSLQFHRKSRPQTIQEWRHEFGFYTDKVTTSSRDEAESIVTKLVEKKALDFNLTGDFDRGEVEKVDVAKENKVKKEKKSSPDGKRLNPIIVFVALMIIVCGIAFLFPAQIINGISSVIFGGSDKDSATQVVSEEVNRPINNEPPAIIEESIDELNALPTIEEDIAVNNEIELERERLVAEREEIDLDRQRLEEERRQQIEFRLVEENRSLQERLTAAETDAEAKNKEEQIRVEALAKKEQEEKELQEKAQKEKERLALEAEEERLAEEQRQKGEVNSFAVFLERLVFPDVNTMFRGVINVCEFYSEDDPGACISNINSCKDFAQTDQNLFRFCASEYVNKLISLSDDIN